MVVSWLLPSVLLPVLQAKAKRGPPRQAKYAIHCINAMFSNRDTHFAQIFEVSRLLISCLYKLKVKISFFFVFVSMKPERIERVHNASC